MLPGEIDNRIGETDPGSIPLADGFPLLRSGRDVEKQRQCYQSVPCQEA
jgi:hypothetical protein